MKSLTLVFTLMFSIPISWTQVGSNSGSGSTGNLFSVESISYYYLLDYNKYNDRSSDPFHYRFHYESADSSYSWSGMDESSEYYFEITANQELLFSQYDGPIKDVFFRGNRPDNMRQVLDPYGESSDKTSWPIEDISFLLLDDGSLIDIDDLLSALKSNDLESKVGNFPSFENEKYVGERPMDTRTHFSYQDDGNASNSECQPKILKLPNGAKFKVERFLDANQESSEYGDEVQSDFPIPSIILEYRHFFKEYLEKYEERQRGMHGFDHAINFNDSANIYSLFINSKEQEGMLDEGNLNDLCSNWVTELESQNKPSRYHNADSVLENNWNSKVNKIFQELESSFPQKEGAGTYHGELRSIDPSSFLLRR